MISVTYMTYYCKINYFCQIFKFGRNTLELFGADFTMWAPKSPINGVWGSVSLQLTIGWRFGMPLVNPILTQRMKRRLSDGRSVDKHRPHAEQLSRRHCTEPACGYRITDMRHATVVQLSWSWCASKDVYLSIWFMCIVTAFGRNQIQGINLFWSPCVRLNCDRYLPLPDDDQETKTLFDWRPRSLNCKPMINNDDPWHWW